MKTTQVHIHTHTAIIMIRMISRSFVSFFLLLLSFKSCQYSIESVAWLLFGRKVSHGNQFFRTRTHIRKTDLDILTHPFVRSLTYVSYRRTKSNTKLKCNRMISNTSNQDDLLIDFTYTTKKKTTNYLYVFKSTYFSIGAVYLSAYVRACVCL